MVRNANKLIQISSLGTDWARPMLLNELFAAANFLAHDQRS